MTNQEDPSVTNKLLMADKTADLLWHEPPSKKQNEDDYNLRNDGRAETNCSDVTSLVPFTDSLTGNSRNDSDSEAWQINSKGDVAHLLPGPSAPVVPRDLNSSRTGTQTNHLTQPKTETGCYGPDELWLNTDKVFTSENEHAILAKQDRCNAGDHNEGRKVSVYPLEMVATIGSPIDDSWFRMPPVKTWPSVDSWADTGANIVHIVLSSSEEPPAIVIQTLGVMAIKDKDVKLHQTQETTKTPQQMCLITAGKDNSELTAERGEEEVQTLLKIQAGDSGVPSPDSGDKGDRGTPLTEEHSSQVTSDEARWPGLPCTIASEVVHESDMTGILPSQEYFATAVLCDNAEDITPVRERMPFGEEDMEIYYEKHISSPAPEEEKFSKPECQNSSEEPQTPELETGGLWKVTEDTLSPPYVDIRKEVNRSRALEFLSYPCEPSAVKPVQGHERGCSAEGLSPDTVLQSAAEISQGHACALAQKSPRTQTYTRAEGTDSEVRQEDKPVHVNLQGKRNEGLDFIMPLAPVCQRNIRRSPHATLKGDQQQARILETERNQAFDTSGAFSFDNKREDLLDVDKGKTACSAFPSGHADHDEKLAFCCAQSLDKDLFKPSFSGDTHQSLSLDSRSYKTSHISSSLSKEFSKLLMLTGDTFFVCEEEKTACITLALNDHAGYATWLGVEDGNRTDYTSALEYMKTNKTRSVPTMPHKSSRSSSGVKTSTSNKSKEKPTSHKEKPKQAAAQASKKQETPTPESLVTCESPAANRGRKAAPLTDVEPKEITEKGAKSRGKKKKKQSSGKPETETSKELESSARPKTSTGKTEQIGNNDKLSALTSPTKCLQIQNQTEVKNVTTKVKGKCTIFESPVSATGAEESQSTALSKQQGEHILKRRHLFENKDGKRPTESKPQKSSHCEKKEELPVTAVARHRKDCSEVVKQKPQAHKEVPKVLEKISAEKLSDDSGSICLRCQFSAVSVESSVVWTKEGTILEQVKRSAFDESVLPFIISKPSSKDLGRYQCCLSCPLGTLASEFYLTSDVLIELLPSQDHHAAEVVEGVEEDVKCTPLLFREDFLSEQYFGENQPASILTEQVHFGEGMHRRAFRTKLLGGMAPVFSPGRSCVLKVHNAVSQGTRNNEELVHKNYSLAVEECCVQNTAREYIKAYTTVAKTAEDFGEVPEIIPILLVHRPSSNIPYATLEEELIGDFVKYSVKDGKEINLTRRDSEPGQKCCAFQHWVYNKTEGNLLVTDMQGVGMKLTDVGIATPKKGYKGFRGNCATSFIDQFKALHQCNKFCELLGLKPLQPAQPKPKRMLTAPNPKPQPQPKKKTFAVNLKSKT